MTSQHFQHRWVLTWVLLAIVAVLAAGAWWQTRVERDEPTPAHDLRTPESADTPLPNADAKEATMAASSSNFRRPKLEPITLPEDASVSDMLDLLGDRARAGDAQAACELAHVIDQCQLHFMIGPMRLQPATREQSAEQLDQFVEAEARRLEAAELMDQYCNGIGPKQLEESARFTARAALSGHVDSLIDFISAPDFKAAAFIRDPELAHLYRERLWPVLLRGLTEGNAQVAEALFSGLGSARQLAISAAVPARFNDHEAARAVSRMLRGIQHIEARQIVSLAPPSAEAQATADAWIQELFGGSLPTLPASPKSPPDPLSRAKSTCKRDEAWLGADQR